MGRPSGVRGTRRPSTHMPSRLRCALYHIPSSSPVAGCTLQGRSVEEWVSYSYVGGLKLDATRKAAQESTPGSRAPHAALRKQAAGTLPQPSPMPSRQRSSCSACAHWNSLACLAVTCSQSPSCCPVCTSRTPPTLYGPAADKQQVYERPRLVLVAARDARDSWESRAMRKTPKQIHTRLLPCH